MSLLKRIGIHPADPFFKPLNIYFQDLISILHLLCTVIVARLNKNKLKFFLDRGVIVCR